MCTKCIHGQVSMGTLIDTLNQHLNQYSIDIPFHTQSTLYWHLINSLLIVGPVSTDSYELTENESMLNQVSTKMLITCQRNVDLVWIKCQLGVLIEGINWHLTADAFITHIPNFVSHLSAMTSIL